MNPRLFPLFLLLLFETSLFANGVVDSLSNQLLTFQQEQNIVGQARTHLALASTFKEAYEFEQADHHGRQALLLARSNQLTHVQFQALYVLGNVAFWQDRYPEALERLIRASNMESSSIGLEERAESLSLLAQVYLSMGKNKDALFHQFQARNFSELANDSVGMAKAYNSLGIMYYQGKEYEIGDQYLDQSLQLYRRLEIPIHLWSVLATLASGKLEQEQAAAALVYGEEAIVLARKIKYAYGEAFSTGTLGLILTEQGKWEAARKQLDTALVLFSAIGVQAEVAEFSYAIAELARKQGNHAEAVDLLTPVLETALKLPLPRLAKQTYLALADAYEALGQSQAALDALKSHQLLQDSLDREKESRQFSEAESTFDIQQRQEKEFAALSAKQEMEHRIYLFGFISALTLCVIFSIWLGNRLQKERKKRLKLNQQFHTIWQEKNLLSSQYGRLSQLASLASASLHAPLQKVQKALTSASPSDASPNQAFERIENWVSDIALYASVGQVEGDKRPIDLADTVREAIGELPESLSKQMPRIIMKDLPTILGYPQQMTLLFRQLLANAIEYRGQEAPFIEISAQDQGEKYEISLRDNGQGMPAHLTQTLFDVGYRVEGASPTTSAGVGLAICKAIVELHEGHIWAESSPNGGTTILFSLPSSLHN